MKKRILIVEDERSVWESMRDMPDIDSYELEWVQTGHEAVRRSLDRPLDALVLDLDVVDTSGWQVLDCLCGLHPWLPIIALVSNIDDGEVASAIGASAWLLKPVDRRLIKAVQRLLAEPNEKRLWRAADSYHRALSLPQLELAFPG